MITPDQINGAFEFGGGLVILRNIQVLVRDKRVRGVSILMFVFFFSWGVWNLYYYPHLDQWWSFAGGLVVTCGNFITFVLMIYYTLCERRDGH